MLKFDKQSIQTLKEHLFESYVHDSKIERITYDYDNSLLEIKLFNPIFNVNYNLSFYEIETFLKVKGNYFGGDKTINGLTIEDDFSYLKKYLREYDSTKNDSIYLLFQLFSGDELHIISKEVIFEEI